MFKRILVPLDGSSLSERALPIATALAQAMGAQLVLVRAAWSHTAPGLDPIPAQLHAVREAEAYLTAVARRLGEGLSIETAVPYMPAADGILLEIDVWPADLVIMTTHGRTGLSRLVFGSVAEEVLARSSAPVWLIRVNSHGATSPSRPQDGSRPRLLVPLDGSPLSETVLPHAVALARALDWTIVLLRVVVPPSPLLVEPELTRPYLRESLLEDAKTDAHRYLTSVKDILAREGVRVQAWVRVGDAVTAIIDEGLASGASLVMMATHGRTGLGRMVYGSVASAVLHRGTHPLFLLRPTALGAPAEKSSLALETAV